MSSQNGETNPGEEIAQPRQENQPKDAQLQQAVSDCEEPRARLLQQFNLILKTRDTARGLVVNISDVLADSGKFTLRPPSREKLAKYSASRLVIRRSRWPSKATPIASAPKLSISSSRSSPPKASAAI
jgi:hypothetical protein